MDINWLWPLQAIALFSKHILKEKALDTPYLFIKSRLTLKKVYLDCLTVQAWVVKAFNTVNCHLRLSPLHVALLSLSQMRKSFF